MTSTDPRPTSATASQPPSFGERLGALADEYGLTALVVISLVTHAINMFNYPLYLGDEGIYLEQAWAVVREGRLAPYTYFYDHAPGGWILIALWEFLLPGHFQALGMSMNSARVLMLALQVGSTILLYRIARRMTGGHFAGIAAALVFNLSPLGIYYQRMVLLDNVMVFWLLLCLDLLLSPSRRLMTIVASGFAFGLAVLTKENALFFAPVLGYLLYQRVRASYRARFSLVGFALCAAMLVSLYPLYALLKGELLPAGAADTHVSLITTVVWQMGRHGGSVLDPYSQFWQYFWSKWWQKDPLIIIAGSIATTINLAIGLSDRERHRQTLIAAGLAIAFALYLMRGSIMIDFYVVPLLPFFALNVGLLLDWVIRVGPHPAGAAVATLTLVAMSMGFLALSHDEYFVDQTRLQVAQLQFIRQNIPAGATLLIDDDLWVDLHEPNGSAPVYPLAHSHWKIQSDPEISDKLLHNDWRNLDYLVMSNQLHYIFEINNEQLALDAYDHSRLMARWVEGDVSVEVRQVVKDSSSG